MKCVAYVRTAGKEHSESSLSIQVNAIEEYINKQNWQLCKIYKEEKSMGSILNVGLQQVIKETHEGKFDVIISMTSSRLFRHYEQAIQLQELLKQQQVNIITLDNDINTFEGNNKLINKSLWGVN